MLSDFFLYTIYNAVSAFFSLFPVAYLTDSVASSVSTANGYLSALNFIVPVAPLVSIIGLFLSIEVIILTIKIINWFIRKIPTIN